MIAATIEISCLFGFFEGDDMTWPEITCTIILAITMVLSGTFGVISGKKRTS